MFWPPVWNEHRGALASLMAMEQHVSASCMEQAQVALASLVAASQTALASLIDSVVLDLFWQRSMPSFQTNFHQSALMDDLVASSSPGAFLTSFHRWSASLAGVQLLGPGVLAMGEGAVGISSREASPSQHHLGCSPGRMCPLDQKDLPIWGAEA